MQKDSSINDKRPTAEEFRLRETKEAKRLIASNQEESHSRTNSRKELAPPIEPEVLQAQTRGGQRHGRNTDAVGAAAQDEVVDYDSFETMGLREKLLRGVYAFGFEKPSAVQQRGIVPCLQGRDVIVRGQSGTGKTATFTIGLLQQIDLSTNKCQALVLTPTRELARQTRTVIVALGDYMEINAYLAVGGESVPEMKARLSSGVHVAIGTPGRVKHMIAIGALDPRHIKTLVLDEVDVMLSRGFEDQVKDIFMALPNQELQTISVSATLPVEALKIMDKFMRDPVRILLKEQEVPLEGIQQFYIDVEREEHKFATLCDIYETLSIAQSIIFCNTRRKVKWLADYMTKRDFSVSIIHGEQTAEDRKRVMKDFRGQFSRVLITTDVLSHGIDVHHVSLVCNVDLPSDRDYYIHRIGRCDRFGRKGIAISLVTRRDYSSLRELEEYYGTQIKEMPIDINDYP